MEYFPWSVESSPDYSKCTRSITVLSKVTSRFLESSIWRRFGGATELHQAIDQDSPSNKRHHPLGSEENLTNTHFIYQTLEFLLIYWILIPRGSRFSKVPKNISGLWSHWWNLPSACFGKKLVFQLKTSLTKWSKTPEKGPKSFGTAKQRAPDSNNANPHAWSQRNFNNPALNWKTNVLFSTSRIKARWV